MTSSANQAGEPRFLLRNVADIKRLFTYLLTHWQQPHVEFSIDGLHVVHSQRAQDRFVRLADACNCLLGAALAAITLLVGSIKNWASFGTWLDMVLVLLATLFAAYVGKGLELAWTRIKLLRVLLGLQRRLGTAEGSPERDYVLPRIAAATGKSLHPASLEEAGDAAPDQAIQRPIPRYRPRRPIVVLRDAADISRLIRRLPIHWKLPRMEIQTDALPLLDVQRAQHRIVHFSGGCNYLPAAFMTIAVLLGGLLYKVWTESHSWIYSQDEYWWLLKLDWSDAQPVVLAALGAALLGGALEAAWMRLRLLLVLRGLRQRLTT